MNQKVWITYCVCELMLKAMKGNQNWSFMRKGKKEDEKLKYLRYYLTLGMPRTRMFSSAFWYSKELD